jgi:hypothetical protein
MVGPSLVYKSKLTNSLALILRLIYDLKICRFPIFNFMMHDIICIDSKQSDKVKFNFYGIDIHFPYPLVNSDHTFKLSVCRGFSKSSVHDSTVLVLRVPKYNFLILTSRYACPSSNYNRLPFRSSVLPV